MNQAGCQFHDRQEIKSDEAVLGPHLDRRKIDRSQHVPMRLEKGLPSGLSPPFWRRLDAMLLQDVGDAGRGDFMTQGWPRHLECGHNPRWDSPWLFAARDRESPGKAPGAQISSADGRCSPTFEQPGADASAGWCQE